LYNYTNRLTLNISKKLKNVVKINFFVIKNKLFLKNKLPVDFFNH